MIDGLGLVYEKQGNTGAAAYNAPIFEIGNNPLDVVASQIEQQRALAQKAQEGIGNKNKQEFSKYIDAIDLKGWSQDNIKKFAQQAEDLKKEGAALMAAGKDIYDYKDQDVIDYRKKVADARASVTKSKDQGELYEQMVNKVLSNPKKYKRNESMEALNSYMNMDPVARMDIRPEDLLVEKMNPLDPASDLKIADFYAPVGTETATSTYTTEKLDEKKLKEAIKTRVNSQQWDPYYQANKDEFGWKSKDDYADYLFEEKKLHFTPKKMFGLKAASGGGGNMSGMSEQERITAIENTKPTTITVASVSAFGQTRTDDKGSTITKEFQVYHPQNISGVEVVVPGSSVYDASTNVRGIVRDDGTNDRANNYEFNDGNLIIALVNEYGQIIGDKSTTTVNSKVSDTETRKESISDAIKNGRASYKVLLQGNAKISGQKDDIPHPAYVDAKQVVTPDMASKSDGMNDMVSKNNVLQKQADKMNAEYSGASVNTTRPQYSEWKKTNPNKTVADYNKEFNIK